MIQGVVLTSEYPHKDTYIGTVELLPNGRYRAWSEPIATSHHFSTYRAGIEWLEDVARSCRMEGTLRTPEHRMGV